MASSSSGYVEKVGHFEIYADKKHKLGSGATSTVYLGINTITGGSVAAKSMEIEEEFLEEGEFEREADLLLNKIPPHENIVKVYEFSKHKYVEKGRKMLNLWLIMEHCPKGDLRDYALQTELTTIDKLELMYQAALAVHHLHQCKPEPIMHRDIKPPNILISGEEGHPKVKLCDFGASRLIRRSAEDQAINMKSVTGTENYRAPEQQLGPRKELSYDKNVDTFSLGISNLALLEACKGTTMRAKTFNGTSIGRAMYDMQLQFGSEWSGFTPDIDKPTDTPLETAIKAVIKRMIQTRPADRMSMAEVVSRFAELRTSYKPVVQSKDAPTRRNIRPSKSRGATGAHAGKNVIPRTLSDKSCTPRPCRRDMFCTLPKAIHASPTSIHAIQNVPNLIHPVPKSVQAVMHHKLPFTADYNDMSCSVPKVIRASPRSVPAIQNVPRLIPRVPKSVQAVTHHKLPFTADSIVGLGYNGELILGDWDLLLYKVQHDGKEYKEIWKRMSPKGMKKDCYKQISSDRWILLQNNDDEKTVCYDKTLTKQTELQLKGALIDSSNDEVFYSQGTLHKKDWQITVHKTVMEGTSVSGVLASAQLQLGQHRTLEPPSPHGWYGALSVCRTQQGYVVVEFNTRSMDIFDQEGSTGDNVKRHHIRHTELSYEPARHHAITVTASDHLLVAERYPPPAIHVHSVQGDEVATIKNKKLGLRRGDYIHGIRCSTDGLLHVTTGMFQPLYHVIHSLHAYKLLYGQKK